MEKHKPHYRLDLVKQLVSEGRCKHTRVATQGAQAMGYFSADMDRVVLALERSDFYKSMTAFGDHRIWQDVYRPLTERGPAYLKLSVVEDVLIISFKEL